MDDQLEFRVLGPLEIIADGKSIKLDAPKQRAIVAMLLIHANEVVSTDRLIEAVWGEQQPARGTNTLHYHVSKLRKSLASDVIETRAPGYALRVAPDRLDALVFESLLAEARSVRTSDGAAALQLLDKALDLWRGSPYADFAYEEFAHLEAERLAELRRGAVEDRFEILLAEGKHNELIPELDGLTGEFPTRERLWGHLSLALYRSGRQAEAVAAFRQVRSHLGEVGLDLSPHLRELEDRILTQDPSLLVEAAAPERLRGYFLRGRIGEGAHGVVWLAAQPGIGREVVIKAIRPELANQPAFIRRFEIEAQLVASLEHPHIVSLFDFWRDPNGAYLVMPYLRGGSLADRLERGSLDPKVALQVLEDIGAALTYAHRRGVVHRDVTPHNVLLDDDDNPYLADFGVATLVDEVTVRYEEGSPLAAYLSPELADGQPATPASDVFSLGVLTTSMLGGKAELSAEVDDVVGRATAPVASDRFGSVAEFIAELAPVLGEADATAASGLELRNPYKGLRAFGEADAPDFFGRDRLVAELVDVVGRHRLVGVVGPSGCGKSSLVRAGLIPKLRRGALAGSERWLITDMYPGVRPFAELESALLQVAIDHPGDLERRLRAGDWERLVGELLPPDGELLLVVDQFEELFTVTTDAEERRRFLDVLAGLVSDPRHRVGVVATMRADFYDRPLEYPEFAELLRRGLVSVAMPGREAMIEAVEGPALAEGLELEPGLTGTLIGDVADQPGGLPLLEYALTELFRHRDGNRLTAAGYRLTGGVLGALSTRAEELYRKQSASGQEAIRQVLLRLVHVAEGAEDTRRRILLSELQGLEIEGDILQSVLDSFVAHRLLTLDRDPESREPTVEVAHEALLGRWQRLRTWIDDRRDDLVLHRRLVASVDEWRASGGQSEYLLTGGRLDHFESLVADTDLAIGAEETAYLSESRRHNNQLAIRRRRRRRSIMAGFAVAAVIAAVFAVAANQQRRRAEEEASLNRSRVLAAAAIDAIGENDQLALLLGMEAADISLAANGEVLPEAADALHRSLRSSRLEAAVSLDGLPAGRTVELAASPSGLIAVSSTGDTVELRDGDDVETVVATLGTPLGSSEATPTSGPVFAPDGASVAAVGSDGTVRVWDVESRAEIWAQPHPSDGRGGVEYSPDGERLLSAVGTSIVMWDTASGEEIWALETGGFEAIPAFSPDGTRLAVGTWVSKELTLLDAESGDELSKLDTLLGVGSLIWSPEGTHLFAGLETGDIGVVDTAALGVVDTWEGHSNTPLSMAIDSSGTRLATGADDGTVHIWDLATGGEPLVLGVGTGSIDGVAFLPGDEHLVATGNDRLLRVYDVSPEGRGEILAARTGGEVFGIDFGPDGTKLVSLTIGGGFKPAGLNIWDVATGNSQLTIDGLDWASFDGVTFTNDGEGFVVQEWDESQKADHFIGVAWGPVQLRDAATGQVLMSFAQSEGQNRQTLIFSADGSALATGSTGAWGEPMSTASVHDVASGELLHRLDHEDWAVTAVAPSASGDRLATATCERGIVTLWDVGSEAILWSTDYPGCSTGIAFSPDGSFIAASSLDNPPAVWDAATGVRRFDIVGHSEGAYSISISPNGTTIASAGSDGSVLVVDANTGDPLAAIQVADAAVGDIDFSPDGETLAAATLDGLLYVFVLDSGRLVDLAHTRTLRTFTEAECAAYKIDPCPASLG